jgi:hypothetical protein
LIDYVAHLPKVASGHRANFLLFAKHPIYIASGISNMLIAPKDQANGTVGKDYSLASLLLGAFAFGIKSSCRFAPYGIHVHAYLGGRPDDL